MRRQPPVAPKPFFPIKVHDKKESIYKDHSRYSDITGSFEIMLQVKSKYLFVGSGNYNIADNIIFHSFFRSNGNITIPGSSIKGCIRAMLEAISNSCIVNVRTMKDLHHSIKNRIERLKQCIFSEEKKQLCPACSIFGANDYAGRVSFSDTQAALDIKTDIIKIGELFRPQPLPGRKFYQHNQFSAKNNKPEINTRFLEAILANESLIFKLEFTNMAENELALLLYAMGINYNYYLKLGGAKPRCLGAVSFRINKIKLLNTKNLLTAMVLHDEPGITKWCNEIKKHKELLNEGALKEYATQSNKMNEYCPEDLY